MMNALKTMLAVTAMVAGSVASAQSARGVPAAPAYSYADLADFALSGPIIAELRIRKAQKLPAAAANPGSVRQRYLITADVTSVIRAPGGVPPRVEFLYDAPRDALGRLPRLPKANVAVSARPVTGKPQALQLASPDALILPGPNDGATIRAIVKAALDPAAPPEITGIGNAFHTPGTLQGEGDTQIFLLTRDNRPISFNVIRTPAAAPRWSVSVDELVDPSGAQPRRETLLWYRLACFLPATLPPSSTASAPEFATLIAEDYATIVRGLGPCGRTRS